MAKKITATLKSTGTPSEFMHAAEAMHGDLGVCQQSDPVVIVSKSGTTSEMLGAGLSRCGKMRSPLIGILGNVDSPLAKAMDVVLDASVQREADLGRVYAHRQRRGGAGHGARPGRGVDGSARVFGRSTFRASTPESQLGRSLRLRVADVMHVGNAVAWVAPLDSLKRVVVEMSRHPLGAACVVTPEHTLLGLITDGDVRRMLEQHDDIRELDAVTIMTRSPVSVGPDALIHDALRLMEDRPSQISVLPVVEGVRCLGLVRIHDLYRPSE